MYWSMLKTIKPYKYFCKVLLKNFSGLAGIQTPNLLIRSEMLYSVKLRNLFCEGKYKA